MINTWAKLSAIFLAAFWLLLFLLGFACAQYFHAYAQKTHQVNEVVVEIPYGSSLRQVSRLLAEAKVIDDAKKFYWYLRFGRLDGHKMQAGFYNFFGSITAGDLASRLLFGVDQSFRLTFKEGENLKELAQKLDNLGLIKKEAFLAATKSQEVLDALTPGLKVGIEGYLFADTYFFSKKDNALSIINKMHARLRSKLTPEIMARIDELKTSLHQVLTLASIIEKETGDPKERPLIASVYQNRLRLGMHLQADPTVIYGIKDYNGKIRKADLLAFHPYNTYKIKGLPPGPIASAGFESIRAALWPEASQYLYFVSKNDGSHIFCADLTCHNRAVRTWQIDFFKKTAAK